MHIRLLKIRRLFQTKGNLICRKSPIRAKDSMIFYRNNSSSHHIINRFSNRRIIFIKLIHIHNGCIRNNFLHSHQKRPFLKVPLVSIPLLHSFFYFLATMWTVLIRSIYLRQTIRTIFFPVSRFQQMKLFQGSIFRFVQRATIFHLHQISFVPFEYRNKEQNQNLVR